MIFISFSIEKIIVPCPYCVPFVPPNLLHPTKSNLYLANFLATAVSEPALYRLLTFHVPTRMSLFLFLRRDASSRNTPPRDPTEGVVYLRIVLSPEEASHFLNIS
jgi:hypothetical protein